MNKNLLMAIAVGAALTGCVKNETANDAVTSKAKIGFEAPVVSGITRGTGVAGEIGTTYHTNENFSVYARYYQATYTTFDAGTSYMDNVETAYETSDNYWDSENAGGQAYYWPKVGSLTFGAYSPSRATNDCTVTWEASGFKFTGFKVKENPAQHYDLMFSERVYDKSHDEPSSTSYAGGVDINFKHALSSIVFKVKAAEAYDNHTITVKSIKVKNAYDTGNFDQKLEDNGTAKTTAPVWEAQTNENAGYEAVTKADGEVLTTTAAPLTNPNPIIILPQATDHTASDGNKVAIEVVYTIDNGTTPTPVEQRHSAYVSDLSIDEFEIGKRYTFTLSIGLHKITFSPKVEPWIDEVVTPDIEL